MRRLALSLSLTVCLLLIAALAPEMARSDASPPTAATMTLTDGGFHPSSVTILAGGTVTWINGSQRPRGVADDTLAFDSGDLPAGASYSRMYQVPGTYGVIVSGDLNIKATVKVVTPPPPPPPPPVVGSSPQPAPPPGQTLVTISDQGFTPPTLCVVGGSVVYFINAGSRPHTVTSQTPGVFDSGQIAPGQVWAATFNAPGSYAYRSAAPGDLGPQNAPLLTGTVAVIAPTPTPTPLPNPGWAAVTITDYDGFVPQTITTKVNNPVAWHNAGFFVHTVVGDGNDMNSGGMGYNTDYWRRFDQPGVYYYHSTTETYLDPAGQAKYRGMVIVTP